MISLIVPTYNERQNIAELVKRAGRTLAGSGEDYELIIVDDNSPDGTAGETARFQPGRPWLKLIVRQHGRDLSSAVMCGWRSARGEILGCMDGDLQHPPERLEQMIQRMRETRSDVVIASRYVPGGGVSDWKVRRRVISWLATMLARILMGERLGRIRDPMSGFFILKRAVIEKVPLKPIGYKILFEVLIRGRYRHVEEVPFTFEERVQGGSKMGPGQVWRYLLHLVRACYETGEAWRLAKSLLVELTAIGVCVVALVGLGRSGSFDLWSASFVSGLVTLVWRFLFTEPLAWGKNGGSAAVDWRRLIWRQLAAVPGLFGHMAFVWFIVGVLNRPLELAGICGASLASVLYFVFLWSPEFILLPQRELGATPESPVSVPVENLPQPKIVRRTTGTLPG